MRQTPLGKRQVVAASLLSCVLMATAEAKQPPAADASALYQQGLAAGNGGDLRKAVEILKQALAADPKHFLAQFDLGGAYEALADKDQALECYRKTTVLRPDFAEAHGQLGTLYLLHKHDLPQAIESYRRALLIKQPYVDARFSLSHTRGQSLRNLAIAYAEQKRYGLTIGIIDSLQNDPDAEAGGPAVARIGRMASRDLEAALAQEFAAELGAIRPQLYGGQAAEALRSYEAFAKAHPLEGMKPLDRWDLLAGIGMGHAMTGKTTEAVQDFMQAAKAAEALRYGQWQESMWNLACALAESGKPAEAVAALEPVLFVDLVTTHDPRRARKGLYRPKIATDSSLKSIQKHPALVALLAVYPE